MFSKKIGELKAELSRSKNLAEAFEGEAKVARQAVKDGKKLEEVLTIKLTAKAEAEEKSRYALEVVEDKLKVEKKKTACLETELGDLKDSMSDEVARSKGLVEETLIQANRNSEHKRDMEFEKKKQEQETAYQEKITQYHERFFVELKTLFIQEVGVLKETYQKLIEGMI